MARVLACLWLVGALPAHACECLQGGIDWVSPADGQQDVPRNAEIRRFGRQITPLPLDVWVDGTPVETRDTFAAFGPNTLTTTRPVDPLPADADVEARIPGSETPVLVFHTSDVLDTEAPSWSGDVVVEDLTDNYGTCGKLYGLRFLVQDVQDDHWGPSGLLVTVEPRGRGEPGAGNENEVEIVSWMCADEDPTLAGRGKRTYDVRILDGSGNATTSAAAQTDGCGCRQAPGPLQPLPLLLGALVLRRRRTTRWRRGQEA